MDGVVKFLEEDSANLNGLVIIDENYAHKCYLLVNLNSTVNIRVKKFDIKNNHYEKLLRVKFDLTLIFDNRNSELC